MQGRKRAERNLTRATSAVKAVVLAPEGLVPVGGDLSGELAVGILAVGFTGNAGQDVSVARGVGTRLVVADRRVVDNDAAFVDVLGVKSLDID